MSYFNEANPVGDRSYGQSIPLTPLEEAQKVPPGWFAGTLDTTVRAGVELGRAVDLAGSVGPVVQDFFTGGTTSQDQYFREHDEVFNEAIDFWTPSPESVHWSGQIAGGVLGSLLQFGIGGPAAVVGTAQLGTAEDLARAGVDAETATNVGAVQGIAAAIGIRAPFIGSTWARKALSGIAANVPVGVGSRYLSHVILDSQGFTEQAAQFKAFDPVALATDVLMPLVFAGVAQMGEGRAISKQVRQLTEPEKDAVLVTNQAQHMELDSLPGIPMDGETVNAHVAAMTKAADQLLRGEPVDVTQEVANAQFGEPKTTPALDESLVPEPKQPPKLVEPETKALEGETKAAQPETKQAPGETTTPELRAAQQRLAAGDIEIITGMDENGQPIRQKASEALAEEPSLPAKVFDAAVQCFLGGG